MRTLCVIAVSFILASCASKNHLANNPAAATAAEVAKFEAEIQTAERQQHDVFGDDEIKDAREALKDAREDVADGDSHEDIMKRVSEGRTHLVKAAGLSADRTPHAKGIFDARRAALDARVQETPSTKEKFQGVDEDLRDEAASIKGWRSEKTAGYQKRYLDLELEAITTTQLGKAKSQIEQAKKDGAKSTASKTLKKAEVDYRTAENLIAANRNEPARYSDAVNQATQSSEFLNAVVVAINKSDRNLPEEDAMRAVIQGRKISQLEGDLKSAEQKTSNLNQAYEKQSKTLSAAGAMVSVQNAMNAARAQFAKEDADVFQEGERLLIRLKTIKFSSGRTDLPSESLPLLAKVKKVAADLRSEAIVVEGHTDSLGDAAKNMKLSEARAESVATYLGENGVDADQIDVVGRGFEKPIASNRTPSGRAQNRRVDVIITPQSGAGAGAKSE